MFEDSLLHRILDEVMAHAAEPGDRLLSRLRELFPGNHFSLCNDDDVPPRLTPATANSLCRLYYVDSSGHCLQLTNDAAAASGVLVALLDEVEA